MEHRAVMYAIAWRPGVFSVRLLLQIFAVGFIIFILVKHIDAIFSSRFFNEHKPNTFILNCHITFSEDGGAFKHFFR